MIKMYRIKIFLTMFFCITVLCIFNKNTIARGFVQSKEADSSFLQSRKWSQSLQDFLRFELIYGDRKVDQFEAKYLVNTAFQAQTGNFIDKIQPIGIIMTALPKDANVVEIAISQIKYKTNDTNEQVKRLLEEELEKNSSSSGSAKSLCEEIVSLGGNVALEKENSSGWFFYQLLKTQGITPSIYMKSVIDNQLDINYAIESLKFISKPDDYIFLIADFILKEPSLKIKRIKLAEISEYMSVSGSRKLIDMLYNSIPHSINANGEVTYHIVNPSLDSELSGPLGYALRHVMFREEYLKAKKDGNLLDFFASKTLPGKQKDDKSWLLYRYHPELIQPLTEIYNKSNIPEGYDKSELKSVLSGVVKYGEAFNGYTPYLPDMNSLK